MDATDTENATPSYDPEQYETQYETLQNQNEIMQNQIQEQTQAYSDAYREAYTNAYGSGGIPAFLWVIYAVFLVVMVVSAWKIFTKAHKPGWAALIPIYNTYIMLQIVGRPWWWLLLMLIPFVNIVVSIIVCNDLAKSFGKTVAWTVGLIFLPFIFGPMLAFGNAKYHGPSVAPAQQ